MAESYSISQYEQAARLLPVRFQRIALHIPDWQKEQAEELRLRAGHPMTVLLPQGEQSLASETVVTQGDLELLCDTVTGYSRYTASETMARGYITARGGFRVGLCGTVVLQEGKSINLRNLSSACVRIAREIPGLAQDLAPQLFQNGRFCSTLIIAPPGLGKTTLLRELIRVLSDRGTRVAVLDERNELSASSGGKQHFDLGRCSDVLVGVPKGTGVGMLLRGMNPQVIAMDEISAGEDKQVIERIIGCGVSILASAHGRERHDMLRRPMYRDLFEMGAFSNVLTISRDGETRRYSLERLE